MPASNAISQALDARLGRYAFAAGAVFASAMPSQAAPITVILPTPVDIRSGYILDLDQNGSSDFFFSGSGSGAYACYFGTADVLLSGFFVQQLSVGAIINIADGSGSGSGSWAGSGGMDITSTAPATFLGIRFASTAGPMNRIGFAQFYGPNLYGFAWEEARSITTFDLSPPATGVPEPATGALTALALGAVAIAARKRNQA